MISHQQGSSFRIHPVLLILIGAVVLVMLVGVGILIGRGSASSAPVDQEGPASPTASAAEQPTPTTSSAAICPSPIPVTDEMKSRAFDYEEALLIPDPRRQLKVLVAKGLLTTQLQKELKDAISTAPPASEIPGADLDYVLDRQKSTYDLDDEASNTQVRYVFVRPAYVSCRDGKVVQDSTVYNTDAEAHMSTWVKEGAWRVLE